MQSVLWSLSDEWKWYIPITGPTYWTCSFHNIRVVSDIPPPLADTQIRYPSAVQRVLNGIDRLGIRKDHLDWEIWFLGLSCVYVNHAIGALSAEDQSLDDFMTQVRHWSSWNSQYDTVPKRRQRMKMERAYWAYLCSHPNHHDVSSEVVELGLERLGTSYNNALFEWEKPIFVTRREAVLWIEMITAVRDLPDKRLKVYLVASAMYDYSEYSELLSCGPPPSNTPSFKKTLGRFVLVWIFGFSMATFMLSLIRPHKNDAS